MNASSRRRRILAALSFPALIVACLLGWQAYSAASGRGPYLPRWQIYLYFALALILMILFFAGARARHRPPPEP